VIGPFHGGRTLMRGGAAVGGVGLLLAALGALLDLRSALYSWLFAFVFWVGLSVGALLLLATLHATGARWSVVLRRVLEQMAFTVVLFPVLFLPVVIWANELFPWIDPAKAHFTPEELHKVQGKQVYLNVPFFLLRAAVYFAVWCAVAWLLQRWSRRQDDSGHLRLTVWQRRLAGGSLPFVALALSFASLDWLMSLEPLFVSTIYGTYYFAASFLGALALWALAAAWGQRTELFLGMLRVPHLHSLGKLIFAFTLFWAYIAFDQYMLVWLANIPEEVAWYDIRTEGGWAYVFGFLVLGRFALPFFVLLSRRIKESPGGLLVVCGWTFLAHVVDVYWLVFPAWHHRAPVFHWTQPCAFFGIGGLWVAFCVWRLRQGYALPIRDPYLYESLRYHPS
jgi:hypothetical protein